MLAAAARFLPSIFAGLLAGSDESQSQGNGMFLGKRDHTYHIKHTGEGILITPVEHKKTVGFYVKHGDKVYQGERLLHRLFGQIPLLNILFYFCQTDLSKYINYTDIILFYLSPGRLPLEKDHPSPYLNRDS